MAHELYELKPKPDEVLGLLLSGNHRFVEGKLQRPHSDVERRIVSSQTSQANFAMATILSCSDSRVPPEIIFDCGVMDIFVARLAGNVLSKTALASIEYGVLHVYTPLLLVLAHTQCGAITALVNLIQGNSHQSHEDNTHVHEIFKHLEPVVRPIIEKANHEYSQNELINLCAREHAKYIVQQIRKQSPAIAEVEKAGFVKMVPACYELETGKVVCIE